jgi:CDP-diglyceride synthetase
MNKRPFAVTVVGLLMMAMGTMGLVRGFANAKMIWPPEQDLIWIVIVDVTGIAIGIFMLLGKNWARWLALVWVGAHAFVISFLNHREVLVHVVIFALLAYLLAFRSDVRAYFAGGRAVE